MSIDKDLLDELMKGRSAGGLFGKDGVLAELTRALAERALSTELEEHLSEERADPPPEGQNKSPNRRNGNSRKTVATDSGKVVLDIPRDRNGSSGADRQVSAPLPGVRYQDHLHVCARNDDPGNPRTH